MKGNPEQFQKGDKVKSDDFPPKFGVVTRGEYDPGPEYDTRRVCDVLWTQNAQGKAIHIPSIGTKLYYLKKVKDNPSRRSKFTKKSGYNAAYPVKGSGKRKNPHHPAYKGHEYMDYSWWLSHYAPQEVRAEEERKRAYVPPPRTLAGMQQDRREEAAMRSAMRRARENPAPKGKAEVLAEHDAFRRALEEGRLADAQKHSRAIMFHLDKARATQWAKAWKALHVDRMAVAYMEAAAKLGKKGMKKALTPSSAKPARLPRFTKKVATELLKRRGFEPYSKKWQSLGEGGWRLMAITPEGSIAWVSVHPGGPGGHGVVDRRNPCGSGRRR